MTATTPSAKEIQEAEDYLQHLTGSPPVFNFWSSPEDPDNPRLPYIPGFTVEIRRHMPPSPFGGRDCGMGPREELPISYLYEMTLSELVVHHPGLGTSLPALSEAARLTILRPIAIGGVRGAQVVACELSPWEGGKPSQAIAKIYDPMYYNFEWYYNRQPWVTVWQADSDYSREAAAYEHLQKNEIPFAPKYFGSWTFDPPVTSRGVRRTRPVRMILIERLNGVSMRNMRVRNNPDPEEADDAFHYPEEYCLEVLAIAMDQYVRMLHSGLDQRCFASQNIMLTSILPTKPSTEIPIISGIPLPRVMLINYAISVVYSLTAQGTRP